MTNAQIEKSRETCVLTRQYQYNPYFRPITCTLCVIIAEGSESSQFKNALSVQRQNSRNGRFLFFSFFTSFKMREQEICEIDSVIEIEWERERETTAQWYLAEKEHNWKVHKHNRSSNKHTHTTSFERLPWNAKRCSTTNRLANSV